MTEKIPSPVIGVLGEVFSDHYTHSDIGRLFAYADAPIFDFTGNKVKKTVEWLRLTNKQSDNPHRVLGAVLEELMEKPDGSDRGGQPTWSDQLKERQARVVDILARSDLAYVKGGHIASASSSSTKSLQEMVESGGLSTVEIEIDRALRQVSTDPNGAAQYAGNVLEAALKVYLTRRNIPFSGKETLSVLWPLVRNDLGLNPQDMGSNDLRKIASGLNSIVDGTMFLRNDKSGAHGKSEDQAVAAKIKPRHARLAIHAAHTLALYILECLPTR